MKLKTWIRNKLKKFLDFYILENNQNMLVESYAKLQCELEIIKKLNQDVLNKNEYIMSQFNLAADISPSQSNHSWAVISIQGKPEYVKFVNLSNRDMRSISIFLRQFEGTNRTIDSPFGMDFLKF